MHGHQAMYHIRSKGRPPLNIKVSKEGQHPLDDF